MFKIYKYLFLVLVIFVVFNIVKNKIKGFLKDTITKYKLDTTEIDKTINYNIIPKDNITYLFWSGGISSTFRLCKLILIEEKQVQTIYILDDDYESNYRQKKEIEAIKKIRKQILKDYPFIKPLLPPTRYITSIKKNKKISDKYYNLHNNYGYLDKNYFLFNLCERMIRYSQENDFKIELCFDKDDYQYYSILKNNIEEVNIGLGLTKLKNEVDIPELVIFNKCLFPLLKFNKSVIKQNAAKNNILYLLNMTYSCLDNKNIVSICGKCSKCIKSPILIP